MATVSEALQELSITEWVLRGEPTSEAEFKTMFRKVTGADANGSAIESEDTSKWGVTWKQVSDKMTAIDAAAPLKQLRDLPAAAGGKDATLKDGVLENVTWPSKPA